MGILGRLGTAIKSYISDWEEYPSGNERRGASSADPDLNAAFEELNDYLNPNGSKSAENKYETQSEKPRQQAAKPPPEELRGDYAELGVPFGAGIDECKTAYKKLLKIHHPDRHAGHAGNFKKATEKSARINAAWDRIEKWLKPEKNS